MREQALKIATAVLQQPGIPTNLREAAVRLSDFARNRGEVLVEQQLNEVRKLLDEFVAAREAEIDTEAVERAGEYGRGA